MGDDCRIIHEWFNSLDRFRFPFDNENIPLNGVYVLFENGESAHGMDRIVRVGTHTGKDQLKSRLEQHFLKENKDRSIFRKNIGRALLNKAGDSFLEEWELDLTPKKSREENSRLDFDKQKQVERLVTDYIQNNFSFVAFEVNDKQKRLELESRIISTVSLCGECAPSGNWLGLFSPKEKIRESGLWLMQGLYKQPFSAQDMKLLEEDLRIR